MEYKTTIEVVTEADSAYEAADIAGEFLKGNIRTGADIRVKTVSSAKSRKIKAMLAICVATTVGGLVFVGQKVSRDFARVERKPVTSYAIQPPLKTSSADLQNSREFQEIWEKEQRDRLNSAAR
jgi:hypothetical protein